MHAPSADRIHLEGVELRGCVGVPDEERANPQRLVVSLTLWPRHDFTDLQDDLTRTIDYAAVAKAVRAFVGARRDKLIETLASAIAAHLLSVFALRAVRIELRKFVIPHSEYVSVILTRERVAD